MVDLLNLPRYRVLRVEEAEHDYHIYAASEAVTAACALCDSSEIGRWGTREALFRDLPIHGKRVAIYVRLRRFRCRKCERTFQEALPLLSEKRLMTERLMRWVSQQSVKRTFASIADDTGVDEKTIRNIFKDYVASLDASTPFVTPRWLGLDEIHILKKPRAVITNVEHRTVVDILENRNKATIVAYLHAIPDRKKIEVVAMDMWVAYRTAAAEVLPQARVVVDKFHVLRMAEVALESVRKSHRASLTPKARRGLMHDRFILLRREANLNESQRIILEAWTGQYPLLGQAYRLKESFHAIYDAEDRHEAADAYARWTASIPDDLRKAFSPITTAWGNWHDAILAYFDDGVTNAYTESLNNLIRLTNRIGRGYSFDVLRAKILYTEGLHKRLLKKPKFKRLREDEGTLSGDILAYRTIDTSTMMQGFPPTEPTIEEINVGVDISTLIEEIEAGRF